MNKLASATLHNFPDDVDFEGSTDRRHDAPRAPLSRIVFVTPLDKQMKPLANPFRCMTEDISKRGVRFCHDRPIKSEMAVLTITMPDGKDVDLLFRVVRTEGGFGGKYSTAGEFVQRLGQGSPEI